MKKHILLYGILFAVGAGTQAMNTEILNALINDAIDNAKTNNKRCISRGRAGQSRLTTRRNTVHDIKQTKEWELMIGKSAAKK